MLVIIKKFIEDKYVLGLCALERGGSLSKLHFQMVCKIYIFNIITLNKLIKKTLGWDDVTIAPLGHHVHCKLLKGVGMHTYTNMNGYDLKDQREEHFQFCLN
jgi:hypothetical protein